MHRRRTYTDMSFVEMSEENIQPTAMSVDVDAGKQALLAFWEDHGLLEFEETLRNFLGTHTIADLDDVHSRDLRTLHAIQWAQARLTVVAANRLARAVKIYQAKRHPYPEPGYEHLPRCREDLCQNGVGP